MRDKKKSVISKCISHTNIINIITTFIKLQSRNIFPGGRGARSVPSCFSTPSPCPMGIDAYTQMNLETRWTSECIMSYNEARRATVPYASVYNKSPSSNAADSSSSLLNAFLKRKKSKKKRKKKKIFFQ